jgi:hypothetical protein
MDTRVQFLGCKGSCHAELIIARLVGLFSRAPRVSRNK